MEEKKYTCAHCKTGIVNRLPARCPECDKELNKEVEKREKRKLQHARKHIEQPASIDYGRIYIICSYMDGSYHDNIMRAQCRAGFKRCIGPHGIYTGTLHAGWINCRIYTAGSCR